MAIVAVTKDGMSLHFINAKYLQLNDYQKFAIKAVANNGMALQFVNSQYLGVDNNNSS